MVPLSVIARGFEELAVNSAGFAEQSELLMRKCGWNCSRSDCSRESARPSWSLSSWEVCARQIAEPRNSRAGRRKDRMVYATPLIGRRGGRGGFAADPYTQSRAWLQGLTRLFRPRGLLLPRR